MKVNAFFLAATLVAAPILSGVAAINFLVDAKGVYFLSRQPDEIAAYVEKLKAARYGLEAHPFERPVKFGLARTSQADCYVTGSSHEMQFSLETMPWLQADCRSLVNLATSGGGLEDAVTQLAVIMERRPRSVYVGLGPWFFKYDADSRWELLEDDYIRGRVSFGLTPRQNTSSYSKLFNLINGDYLRYNLSQLLNHGFRRTEISQKDVPAAPDDGNLFRPDGSLEYGRRHYLIAKERLKGGCDDYKVKPPFVDPVAVVDFSSMIDRLMARGIRVILVLTPYHPLVWDCAMQTPRALKTVEALVQGIAERRGISVLGSYNAEALGLAATDFDDDMHMTRDSLRHLNRVPDKIDASP